MGSTTVQAAAASCLTVGMVLSFASAVLLVVVAVASAAKRLWRARQTRRFYERQGIRGPVFRFLVGNIPEIQNLAKSVPESEPRIDTPTKFRVIPELCAFSSDYGKISIHELGSTTRLVLADCELMRQVFLPQCSSYMKADLSREALKAVTGNGVVVSDGDFWKQQRRILTPAFKMTYLKGLMKHMFDAGEDLVRKWSSEMRRGEFEINVHKEMGALTLDIITRASFGADIKGVNATEGYAAFEALDKLLSSGLLGISSYERLIPGYSWLPTPSNLQIWKSERYINKLLRRIIHSRWEHAMNKSSGKNNDGIAAELFGNDLLGRMLEAVDKKSPTMTMPQLLDECKTIFFAGHSTTALTLTWTLVMLAMHPEWQQRARDEISTVLGAYPPDVETLSQMEVVTAIIHEVLRLFPPVSSVSRQCQQAHQLGDYSILPGTIVMLPISLILQSKQIWGEDAYQFNPARFSNKKSLKDLPEFMAFGAGPRMCLGMNFALMEAKMMVSLLLKQFTFTLSPTYQHAPGTPLNMKPTFGAPLLVKQLNQCST